VKSKPVILHGKMLYWIRTEVIQVIDMYRKENPRNWN